MTTSPRHVFVSVPHGTSAGNMLRSGALLDRLLASDSSLHIVLLSPMANDPLFAREFERPRLTLLDQPPHHPYTGLLVDSVPALKRGWLDARRNVDVATLPPLSDDAVGTGLCSFRARCAARVAGRCNTTPPPLRTLPSGAQILCHRSADELKLLQPLRGVA